MSSKVIRRVRTDNPEGTAGEVDVHTGEGGHASPLHLEDVIRTLERVRVATEVEREVGQAGHLVALDGVLAVPRLGSADLSVEHLSDVSGHGNERSAWGIVSKQVRV